MSLQLAAQHIQKHGRNGDSMLVHMTPKEVKSLNDLAMAHGGQLTINPQTGLPEAGFLSSILPMVAGVGLNMAFPGLGALGSGLLVGGLTGVATGSLSKGLMAGMGAYGGAGLGGSLAETGMQAEAQAAQAAEAAKSASSVAAQAPAAAQANVFDMSKLGMPDTTSSVLAQPGSAADILAKTYSAPTASNLGAPMTASGAPVADLTASQRFDYMGQGLKKLGTGEGWSQLSSNAGGPMGLAKYGIAAASPVLDEARQSEAQKPMETDKDLGQRYTYDAGQVEGPYKASPTGVEQRYFNPQYQKVSNQQAQNIFGFADGGQVPAPGTPTQYSYDPTAQMFNKIDSMPSDDQTRQASETAGRGGKSNPGMTDAAFAAQQAQGESNAKAFGMEGMTPAQMVMAAVVPGYMLAKTLFGGESSSAQGPASSPGEAASSSTGSGNQAAKAAAIASAMGGGGGGGGSGATSGLGGASGAVGSGTGVGPGSSGSGSGKGGLGGTGGIGGMNSGGGGSSGGGGGCFITSAAVQHAGEKDNGEVLNTLRHFRDTYMRENKDRQKDIEWYYKNAPKIVNALDNSPVGEAAYKKMFAEYIKPAYAAIKSGNNEEAYKKYKRMIKYAEDVSGIGADEITHRKGLADGGIAAGGLSDAQYNLGGYSDGGRLLRGPGDGVSDSIPAMIGHKQPARLADGEFVVPARIVSELGNGSTEAGARKLYAMMERVQAARNKTVGKGNIAKNSKAERHLPA